MDWRAFHRRRKPAAGPGNVLIRTGPVLFGYPVGGSVTLAFHASCLRLVEYECSKPFIALVNGLRATPQRPGPELIEALIRNAAGASSLAKMAHCSGLYVADNRQTLGEKLLASNATWLLQVDTDIEFPSTLVESMLALAGSERRVLAASVPLGSPNFPTCGFIATEKPWEFDCLRQVPLEGIEVDAVATACVLIHREVLETIAARHGQCWFNHLYLPKSPPGTEPSAFRFHSQGEDIAFCVRAKEAGFKI